MARSRKEHQEISRLLLGYSDPRVHSLMDWHVRFLGPGHRIAGHSLQMLDAIEMLLGPDARREALLHLLVDARIVRMNESAGRVTSRGFRPGQPAKSVAHTELVPVVHVGDDRVAREGSVRIPRPARGGQAASGQMTLFVGEMVGSWWSRK